MRTQGATIVAAALAFVAAAPASAVTGGFGLTKTLQAGVVPTAAVVGKSQQGRRSSCEADSPLKGTKTKKTSGLYGQLGREVAPVACEQPPRSELMPNGALKHATAAALSVLG